ncbi:response regulator transcription factor [Anaerovorax odorimutans]|uniref:Stage 0 sporulation protein A homolog n=1 Tax=Anaerovorax odorimutans TaxID=109327 RepID=A0ABT1RMI4_9FIRM|nr:response regulator transcription factor [Anaerovorax odorimutans]MCQ4636399.1 response regulator transcription factor [Anaerovorax odorimutans]
METILIIEDDRELNQGLAYALEKEGYGILSAFSMEEAKEICGREKADLILLDVNLPDGEGFEFCQWIKERQEVPVIFLTARDLEEDALQGYELGADDYITKPFSVHILLKKISVILKRSVSVQRAVFDDGFLKLDFDRASAQVAGEDCPITPTEFRMLRLFTEHAGQLLTYSQLLERLWDCGGQFVDKHALAVNVNRLRKKIEKDGHKYISNVYGMGYQWLD